MSHFLVLALFIFSRVYETLPLQPHSCSAWHNTHLNSSLYSSLPKGKSEYIIFLPKPPLPPQIGLHAVNPVFNTFFFNLSLSQQCTRANTQLCSYLELDLIHQKLHSTLSLKVFILCGVLSFRVYLGLFLLRIKPPLILFAFLSPLSFGVILGSFHTSCLYHTYLNSCLSPLSYELLENKDHI